MKRAIAATALFFLSACSRAPRDPVREVVDGVVRAAERRDADGVVAFLSASFRDANGEDREEAAATVRRYLAAYESLSLSVSGLATERGPESAEAAFVVAMSGRPRAVGGLEGLLPRTSRWRFRLRLEVQKGAWKISHAEWTRLEEGDSP